MKKKRNVLIFFIKRFIFGFVFLLFITSCGRDTTRVYGMENEVLIPKDTGVIGGSGESGQNPMTGTGGDTIPDHPPVLNPGKDLLPTPNSPIPRRDGLNPPTGFPQ